MGAIERGVDARAPWTARGPVAGTANRASVLGFHSPSAALSVTPVRGPARGVTLAVCSLVAACAAVASLIPVDRVVVAQGRVVAVHRTSVVQPLETAIVRSIEVREGQVVRRGELLARLDPTFALANLNALAAQVTSLEAENARLEAEHSDQSYRAPNASTASLLQGLLYEQGKAERRSKRENYQRRMEALEEQIRRSLADQAAYAARLEGAIRLETMYATLEQSRAARLPDQIAATDKRLEISRSLGDARAQANQSASDWLALRSERDAFEQQWRGGVSRELHEAQRKLSDAREELAKAGLRHRLAELRAEQDSVVLTVARVSPGSVLQSGDQFLTLVPLDAPLEVEANVAGADAGFVHSGNAVTVKFDTFPFTQYGAAEGTVRVVSPDSFAIDPDQPGRSAPSSQPRALSFYRARVTLDRVVLHDTPPGFRVMPGMPVTADVKVGKRTVMGYLLGRVLPIALEGMREP